MSSFDYGIGGASSITTPSGSTVTIGTVTSGQYLQLSGTTIVGNTPATGITGSLTATSVPVATGSSTVANSSITDSGTAVTVANPVTATSFKTPTGTAAQLLAADGSLVTAGTNVTITGGTISASSGLGEYEVWQNGAIFNISAGGPFITSGSMTKTFGSTTYFNTTTGYFLPTVASTWLIEYQVSVTNSTGAGNAPQTTVWIVDGVGTYYGLAQYYNNVIAAGAFCMTVAGVVVFNGSTTKAAINISSTGGGSPWAVNAQSMTMKYTRLA